MAELGVFKGIFLSTMLLLFFIPGQCEGRTDPSTGRIRVLFLGEFYSGNRIMLDWITAEPRFQLTIVPCSLQNVPMSMAKKMTRLYVPRTYSMLTSGYDTMIFEDFGPMCLLDSAIENFRRSIEEEGVGLGLIEFANWGGVGSSYVDMWIKTSIESAFPSIIDLTTDISAEEGRTFYRIMRRDPLFNLPGVEETPINGGHQGDIFPKPGSVVQAEWRGRGTPALITGSYGKGNTLQLSHGWDNIRAEVRTWEYGPDLIYNQVLFTANEPVPEDLTTAHKARKLFIEMRIRRVITVSTLEFIENFGGEVSSVDSEFRELEEMVNEARRVHVEENDPQRAADILGSVLEVYPVLEARMIRVKENALVWIYLIEWCVVSATSTITAVVVCSLMVKRSLYREVSITRLDG